MIFFKYSARAVEHQRPLHACLPACTAALALLAGALFSSVDAAGAALPAYITTLLYFAGFFIPW